MHKLFGHHFRTAKAAEDVMFALAMELGDQFTRSVQQHGRSRRAWQRKGTRVV
jgi:hypothetical protein